MHIDIDELVAGIIILKMQNADVYYKVMNENLFRKLDSVFCCQIKLSLLLSFLPHSKEW
jgi:hypothetical protein